MIYDWDQVNINCVVFDPVGPLKLATILSVEQTKAIVLKLLKERFPLGPGEAFRCYQADCGYSNLRLKYLGTEETAPPPDDRSERWRSFCDGLRQLRDEYRKWGIFMASYDEFFPVSFPSENTRAPKQGLVRRIRSWLDRRVDRDPPALPHYEHKPIRRPPKSKDYFEGASITWH